MPDRSSSKKKSLADENPDLRGLIGLLMEMDLKSISPENPISPNSSLLETPKPVEIPKPVEALEPVEILIQETDFISHEPVNHEPVNNKLLDSDLNFNLDSNLDRNLKVNQENFDRTNLDNSDLDDLTQSETSSHNASNSYQSLQQLLFGEELAQLDRSMTEQISQLEHQLYDPQKLAQLLMPSIAEALEQRINYSREDVVNTLAPIIDQIVTQRIQNDQQAMSQVFASIISPTLSKRIEQDRDDVAQAISPVMGKALKNQVALEEGPVIDALYPIIGGTISKYLAETVKQINAQIEDSLSVKGIIRKIRAKIQGVSEAELILKEAMPFQVQGLFLIHKMSGLIIAESQPESEESKIESDMMAGMLTAIRSFANDCMTQSNQVADLNILDYGASKVFLEVAGNCYLAIVAKGEIDPSFVTQMRQMMSHLVRTYGETIEAFEGDTENLPSEITQSLTDLHLLGFPQQESKQSSPILLYLSLGLVSAIVLPWGGWQYYQHQNRQAETQAQKALLSSPEVSVYNIAVKARWGQIDLAGRVPNVRLRHQAETLVHRQLPDRKVNNQIYAIQMPIAEEITQAEVDRLTQLLNQRPGSQFTASFKAGQIQIDGRVGSGKESQTVTQTFSQIVGVDRVMNNLQVQRVYLEPKIFFNNSSSNLVDPNYTDKLRDVAFFMQQHPEKYLVIIGHSKNVYNESEAAQLALDRAKAVHAALILTGVSPDRLQVRASTYIPPEVKSDGNNLDSNTKRDDVLSRCVLFEILD